MKLKLFIIFSIFLIFYGCGFGKTEWQIDELYMQKIEGTSKVIYKFSAWGGRDSNARGFMILDSAEAFEVDYQHILPFYQLSEIPDRNGIEGIAHDCYGTCGDPYYNSVPIFKPMKTEQTKINDIKLTNRIYQYKGYSEHTKGLEKYVFEKFRETKDSLFFYNLNDVESMNGKHLDQLKVKKGEIYIVFKKNNEIKKIIVNEVKLHSKTESIEEIRDIFLTPKNKIFNNEISERGIFREVNISH